MAKDKKSFLLYVDLIETVGELSDKEAGQLFKHVLQYVNDKNPVPPNKIVAIAFRPIEQSLKRDLKKYEKMIEDRKKAGKNSALKRAENKEVTQQVLTPVKSVEQASANPTVSVSDSVSVSDIITKSNSFNAPDEKLIWEIGNERFTETASAVILKHHRNYLEQRVYGTGLTMNQVLERFDSDYKGDSFNNTQHFRNAIKVTIERLINEKNGSFKPIHSANNSKPIPGNLHSGRKTFGDA